MSKQYRKAANFSNIKAFENHLKGLDLSKNLDNINWKLVEGYNRRIIEIGEFVQRELIIPNDDLNVRSFLENSFSVVVKFGLILKLGNQGRAYERVYYDWMLGRVIENLFIPFIKEKMQLNALIRIGGDNLDNLKNANEFKRISAPDFYDPTKNISIDVQCGKTKSKTTIKKSKVDHVIKSGYNGYAFGIGLFTGEYAIINLNQLNNAKFTKGGKEGQLTTEVENIVFEPWSKSI